MSISEPFIRRPIATTLLTAGVALSGALAFYLLPVSPLPQVDFPTIQVQANLPGADPQTMASSVATPLEREFGHIAGVTEMTSQSTVSTTSITLQFDLSRDINGAARDVQAAINAARANLPSNLPGNPTYRKVNPSDSPIMILALTSSTYTRGQMYDTASTVLAQKISQVEGVGQVSVGGSSLPAVRVEVNPTALNGNGLSLEDLRTALGAANANRPKGHLANGSKTWTIQADDQLLLAAEYRPLIVAYRNGAPVRVADVADVEDSVEDLRNSGYDNGDPSVLLLIYREPNANIIDTVERIKAIMPRLSAECPGAVRLQPMMDRTGTIRASISDVEKTLLIAIALVILVVFVFLRDLRTMFIPGIAVPVSLVGTFGVMYLCGFSLDNLSLMALTISTGFVVDDAIVVVENITRHLEAGMKPLEAALLGSREIGFTVLSISISLIAVFIPILLMGGLVGRLFREFAVTLSIAIAVSMIVSLTATPMMCALLLKRRKQEHGRIYLASERVFESVLGFYDRTLTRVLDHPGLTLAVLLIALGLNVFLFWRVSKGFFPEQDTGRLSGTIQADQSASFESMDNGLKRLIKIVKADPAVQSVAGFAGAGSAHLFVSLKDLKDRVPVDQVIERLRPKTARVPGVNLYLSSSQDLKTGGRSSAALYQYTLQSDDFDDVATWAPKLLNELRKEPILTDVNSDQQNHGLEYSLVYDRDTASRLGISASLIDSTLYDAFGQRQVSTMYRSLNQYHVVMEAAPKYGEGPVGLDDLYVRAPGGGMVPISAVARYGPGTAPVSVSHQGQFAAVTLSFNLAPGRSLGDAVNVVNADQAKIGMPATVRGSFAGTAQTYQDSLAQEPLLIATALAAVYIVLGILYESFIHPVTILSTLPTAGVGAVLALMICQTDLSLIAVIGIILLIGIVKKNAIMMIDFALAAERTEGKTAHDAIYSACLLRFRPIMMTTFAAMFGAVPLAIDWGTGGELRRPLGITIIGGLLVSQVLTLYTTPVIYLYWERLADWTRRVLARWTGRGASSRPPDGTLPLPEGTA